MEHPIECAPGGCPTAHESTQLIISQEDRKAESYQWVLVACLLTTGLQLQEMGFWASKGEFWPTQAWFFIIFKYHVFPYVIIKHGALNTSPSSVHYFQSQ